MQIAEGVRIAGWDGKIASVWYIKENAFQTPRVDHLENFAQAGDGLTLAFCILPLPLQRPSNHQGNCCNR